MSEINRLDMLKELVEKEPDDDFCRYGLALEYIKLNQPENAFEQFDELIKRHPDYVPAYFMSGQYLYELEKEDEAVERIEQGIEAARRTGDNHALGEMQEYLESIQ